MPDPPRRAGRRTGRGALVALALGLTLVAAGSAAPVQGARPGAEVEVPGATPQAEPVSLAEAYRALVELREPELGRRFAALLAEAPGAARDALLLRAGADLPPGATAAQRAQHAALAGEGLALVRAQLEGETAEAWRVHLAARLTDPATLDLLWSSVARVVGELRRYELAPTLAAALGGPRPQRDVAARAGLRSLFVRVFATREDFEAYAPHFAEACPGEVFFNDLVERDRTARERLIEIFEFDSSRALAHVSDPDSRLRAAAARSVARAVAARRVEVAPAIAALAARLEREREPQAFHAQLEALLELLAGSSATAPEVARLRELLLARLEDPHHYLAASVAHGLSRLPWTSGIDGNGADLARGLGGVARLAVELAPPERIVQPEALVAVLQAARALFVRCQETGGACAAEAEWVRGACLERLEDGGEARSVRLVAAQLLARLAQPADIPRLAAVLGAAQASSPDLRLSLLGTLAALGRRVAPEHPDGARVLTALEGQLDSPLADLRGRALGLLLEEGLEAYAARADLGRMVRRLEGESSGEVAAQLLAFLARHGGPGELEAILEGPAIERLALDSARRGRLLETLSRLARGDGERLMRVVERLVAIGDRDTRLRRLQQGLELVAGLDEAAAAALAPHRHDQVLAWAREMRAASGVRLELSGAGDRFLRRLFAVHAERASPLEAQDGLALHGRAVLLADLHAVDPAVAPRERVLEAFDRALRLADTPGGAPLERVLRDRARFRHGAGDLAGARRDYRRALDLQRAALRESGEPLRAGAELQAAAARALERGDLDLGDLRRAVELLRLPPTEGNLAPDLALDPPLAAVGLGLALVALPVWRLESPPVRVADLELLVDLSLAGGEGAAAVRALLADLPPLPEASPEIGPQPAVPDGEAAVWHGLLADRSLHARLAGLAQRLLAPPSAERAAPPVEPPGGLAPAPAPELGGAPVRPAPPRDTVLRR